MNIASNCIPIFAVIVAQADGVGAGISVYGPIGIICAWLMYRDEKRAQQGEKLRESIEAVAHEMRGVNLNFLMVQASHGPESLRALAEAELKRKQGK